MRIKNDISSNKGSERAEGQREDGVAEREREQHPLGGGSGKADSAADSLVAGVQTGQPADATGLLNTYLTLPSNTNATVM